MYHGDNTLVPDPCSGTHKYTELTWKCVDPTAETMCGYISTASIENNWKTTGCFDLEAFACTVPAGQSRVENMCTICA